MSASAADDSCPLAGGAEGPAALRPLTDVVLEALADGAARRGGPLPAGGPVRVAESVRAVVGDTVPERGSGARAALRELVGVLAEGAADPADPLCAAHLHCPPLAVAAAADLAASALNPSMDSWDQAPAASELEALTCRALAGFVFPGRAGAEGAEGVAGAGGPRTAGASGAAGTTGASAAAGASAPAGTTGAAAGAGPDALMTTGGTESNQLGVLLARESAGPGLRVVCGENAHHSLHRATWLLGLAPPVVVPTPGGVLEPEALARTLARVRGPVLVVATAGTTNTGAVDPLDGLADVARRFGARLHVDAAYGGLLLFSSRLRGRLAGLERADSVTLDLHKLGWQPVAAGLFVVPDGRALLPLGHRAEYLNADDDTEAGLPDLLGRSLRTSRRPDVLKVAVTLRALGREGIGALVDRTCALAREFAALVRADPLFELYGTPELSTVLFRPVGADGEVVAAVRRRLLNEGLAALGRAAVGRPGAAGTEGWDGGGERGDGDGHGSGGGSGGDGEGGRGGGHGSGGDGEGLWLKATLLNPYAGPGDLACLLKLVLDALPPSREVPDPPQGAAPSGPERSPRP